LGWEIDYLLNILYLHLVIREEFLHAGITFVYGIIEITNIGCSNLTKAKCGNMYLKGELLSFSSIILINGQVKDMVSIWCRKLVLVE
jgi:hypothetical protein